MTRRSDFLNDLGVACALAMGTSAAVGALFGLSAPRVTCVGIVLGVITLALSPFGRRPLFLLIRSSTHQRHDPKAVSPTCLLMFALTPLWIPWIDQAVVGSSALLGGPLAGWAIATLVGALIAAVSGWIRLGDGRVTPRSLLLGGLLIPLGIGTLVPALGTLGTGLLGLIGWALSTSAGRISGKTEPRQGSQTPASSGWSGASRGFAVTALALTHLVAVPWFSSDPFVIGFLIAGAGCGFGLGALTRGRAVILGLGLAALGLALGVELPPRLPAIALDHVSSRGADDPGFGYLLPAAVAALLGACTGLGAGMLPGSGRASAAGAFSALILWQLGPGLLGADEAAHASVIVLATLGLPVALSADTVGKRLLSIGVPAAAAATVLLPAPSPDTLPAEAAWKYYGKGRTLQIAQKNAPYLDFEHAADAYGRVTLVLREGVPYAWQRGGYRQQFDEPRQYADRFLGHLPALLSQTPPRRVLIDGLGQGQVADAARQSSPGRIDVVEPSSAVRSIARRSLPVTTRLLADPAVRLHRTWPSDGPWDAVIVDVPPPWAMGGGAPLTLRRLRAVRDSLSPEGLAILRLPLTDLSPAELAAAGTAVGRVFPTVIAWLDPVKANHLVLTAWASERRPEARTVIEAWSRDVLREDLQAAGLREPADLLERALTDRQGLALVGAGGRDSGGTAVVAAARVRRGRSTLPLAALESAGRPIEAMVSLEGLPPDVRNPLEERLRNAESSRTSYLKLLSFLATGKTKEAIGLAAQLAESSTNPARDLRALIAPWLRRGRALRLEGSLEKAQAELATAYAFSPTDPEVNLELARTLLSLGRTDEAVPYVQRARDEDPTSIEPVLLLADVRLAQGRLADAAEGLTKAEPLFPTDVRLLVNLGYVLSQLSVGSEETIGARLARARVLFQRAASLAPRMPQPRAGLAEVYYRQGDSEAALSEIDRALLLAPSCQYHSWRGHILSDLSRLEEAEAALQKAILECPEQLDALIMLGAVIADRGRPADARQMWEQVLAIDPANAAARENLAILEASKLESFVEQTKP